MEDQTTGEELLYRINQVEDSLSADSLVIIATRTRTFQWSVRVLFL